MPQPEKPNWPGLDALRAVAVILVVLFHSGYAPRGFLGVDIFFVLSGFLITTLLVREYETTGRITLRLFYARRFLRLYPALLLTAAFVVIVSAVTRRSFGGNVHDALASIFYVANLVPLRGGLLDHTWTLAIEEQFYLVWPLLLILILRVRTRWILVAATLPVIGLLVLDLVNGQVGDAHTYTRAMGLPLGCALGLAQNHSPHSVPHVARVIAAVAATVVVSALSYAKVERPILRRKERLRPQVAPMPSAR